MNLILSYSIDLTSLYNQLVYFNCAQSIEVHQLVVQRSQIFLSFRMTESINYMHCNQGYPRKSETILDRINLGSPDLVQSKIRLLAIRQRFKIAINLAI